MIPLHTAFISQDHNKINDFSTFFKNSTEKHSQDNFEFLNTLTKLHFLYLASEYLTLANAYHVAFPSYCYISSRFPLSEEEIKTYLGPDTTRDRHPLIKGRAQFEDDLLELISRLICEYGIRLEN